MRQVPRRGKRVDGMSNSRPLRRLAVSRKAIAGRRKDRAAGRWPFGGPSLSTVRRWIRQGVAAGWIEAGDVKRTGKPGRPARLYRLTAAGRELAAGKPPLDEEIRALRVLRLLRRARGRALTEDQVVAAYQDAMAPAEAARRELTTQVTP
jgi:DNA-binding PadR family transcriptional regulator